ncbi:hypothetical protein H5410_003527, partial [Solanum commersonii]
IFGMKIEKGRKSHMNMVQNQKSDVKNEGENLMLNKISNEDTNTKKKKDLYDFVEKTMLDKEQQKDINEEASKPGATIDNIDGNLGIGVSSTSKCVHESTSEPAKEDVWTSFQQNDTVQSPSQAKRQKCCQRWFTWKLVGSGSLELAASLNGSLLSLGLGALESAGRLLSSAGRGRPMVALFFVLESCYVSPKEKKEAATRRGGEERKGSSSAAAGGEIREERGRAAD